MPLPKIVLAIHGGSPLRKVGVGYCESLSWLLGKFASARARLSRALPTGIGSLLVVAGDHDRVAGLDDRLEQFGASLRTSRAWGQHWYIRETGGQGDGFFADALMSSPSV
jgi:hypothetical protein